MKPERIPFWEQQRGDGPVTKWVKSRDYLDEKQKQRLAKLVDPRSMAEQASTSHLSRRALGLCVACGVPSKGGKVRCQACAVEYNAKSLVRWHKGKGKKNKAERSVAVAPEAADATSCPAASETEGECVK
jgi:hypothetical protein